MGNRPKAYWVARFRTGTMAAKARVAYQSESVMYSRGYLPNQWTFNAVHDNLLFSRSPLHSCEAVLYWSCLVRDVRTGIVELGGAWRLPEFKV